MRVAASLRSCTTPAHVILDRLAASPSDRLAKALTALGRAAKTIHILRYAHDAQLRARIQRQLNRGESRHALAARLFFANQGAFRKGDREEIMNKVTALSVLSNAVLVWNSVQFRRDRRGPRSDHRQGRRPRRPRADLAARERAHHPERNLPISQGCARLRVTFRAFAAGTRSRRAERYERPRRASPIGPPRWRLVLDFFRERLGPPVRPQVMPAAKTEDEDEERERERRGSAAAPDRH